ncbi:MAG TPA: DUF3089 domain-containing protein [Chitinophagaceae bacterium]|nr:DUF3089 domain-containing protein [Chitinophagaceae bacterium]
MQPGSQKIFFHTISFITIFLFVITFLYSCSSAKQIEATALPEKKLIIAPDYNSINSWAAHPQKHDYSDSLPKALQKNFVLDTAVDIFFVHPTTYTDREKIFGWNAPVDDDALNKKTDNSTILYQASIFNAAGNVYAPRYRQANYFAYLPHTADDTAHAIAAFDTAYNDVRNAFIFYMQHYNNGKPIIIAAHSQGSTHAKKLLKEFFDGKPLQQQLVAAYLPGMPIEPYYFSSIPACNTPEQTGCVCSWRSFKKGYNDSFVLREKYISIVTNPLTWDSANPLAARRLNKGAVLLNFSRIKPHNVCAEIHNGVLWTSKPKFFGNIFLHSKNYHIADYNLFYMNVRENAVERAKEFLKKK